MNKKTILAITAHADDHITFAGTVFKLQEQGYDYYELVLTDSDEGGDFKTKRKNTLNSEIAEMRRTELKEASIYLNTKELFQFGEHDQDLTYTKELMHKIVEVIRKVKPTIGLCMNTTDVHPDHIAASQLGKEAFRWAAKNFRRELGDPHRTNLVFFSEGTLPIIPSFLVDITKQYPKKEKLYQFYESQAAKKDLDLMKGFAHIRGFHLRKPDGEYAEAFSVEQNILPVLFD
jgi:LmbE family N-acetylglucosaminyl deacetylase